MDDQIQTKPGYKTTEMWIAIGSSILTILATSGVITPEDIAKLQSSWTSVIGGIAVAIINGLYIYGRIYNKKVDTDAKVKIAAMKYNGK